MIETQKLNWKQIVAASASASASASVSVAVRVSVAAGSGVLSSERNAQHTAQVAHRLYISI